MPIFEENTKRNVCADFVSFSPTIGEQFAADIIKGNTQAIFALRDNYTAPTTASVMIPDERASYLRSA